MPKRIKKPEVEPADIAHDVSATLAHSNTDMTIATIPASADSRAEVAKLRASGRLDESSPLVNALREQEPQFFEFAICPVCGSRQTTEICPVDGHRFEVSA